MSRMRLAAAAAILASVLVVVFHVRPGGSDPAKSATDRLRPDSHWTRPLGLASSAECRACHAEVYEEWSASHHRIAYENPEVQRLSNGFQDRDCLPCHIPRPIWETGLGERPLERATRYGEGVDCFTCHFDPHGNTMLGAGPPGPGAPSAPCQPTQTHLISDLRLCAPCHNQHKTHDDWAQTEYAVPGSGYRDCNDCHMPKVQRRDGRIGRSHRAPGAHDPEFLRTSTEFSVERAGPRTLLVTIKNSGVGHHFPADERHRAADLELWAVRADGEVARERIARFRNPYRQEFEIRNPLRTPGSGYEEARDLAGQGTLAITALRSAATHRPERKNPYPESTQIPAGEARVYTLRFPDATQEVLLRLYFRTQPFQSDDEAVLLHEYRTRLD
jgi:hypothetical protein